MRIEDRALPNVVVHQFSLIVERADNREAPTVDDGHLIDRARGLQLIALDQHGLLVALLGDHVHGDVDQNLLRLVLQVLDLTEAGDKEDAKFIIVVLHQVLNQILFEDHVV